MDTVALEAQKRNLEDRARDLRHKRIVPAVLYGFGKENINLQFDYQTLLKAYRKAGENTIINLSVDGGAPEKVLVQQVDFDPVRSTIEHIDLVRVDMNKEVTTHVALNFIGQAPAVKDLGGILSTRDEIEIKCLPDKLIHSIDVNIDGLIDYNTTIHVSDLEVPEGITVLSEPDMMVATVVAPKEEIEEEVEGEEGEEGEEGAEGEEGEVAEGEEKKEEGEKKEGEEKAEEKKAEGGE